MKTIACIIARTSSKRFPGKVLREIGGKKFIEHIIEKFKILKTIDSLYLCTSNDPADFPLISIANKHGIQSYAGSKESVIERMMTAAKKEKAKVVVRITGDNIFTDASITDKMIGFFKKNNNYDYVRTEYLPLGTTAEVISMDALKHCYARINSSASQYLMWYMFDPKLYRCMVIVPPERFRKELYTLSVDSKRDFIRTQFIFNHLKNSDAISYQDILALDNRARIPYFRIRKGFKIKLPDNRLIPFPHYRRILNERIKQADIYNWDLNTI